MNQEKNDDIYVQQEDARNRFYEELALRLSEAGIDSERKGPVIQRVYDGCVPFCDVNPSGVVYSHECNPKTDQANELYHRTAQIANTVEEYMSTMEKAPPVPAKGLDPADDFRLLAEFDDVVLAGQFTKQGCQFVTWWWDPTHEYVGTDHYFGGNYQGAKEDFAVRAGLINRQRLFSPEQLAEIYRCVSDALESDYAITHEREQLLQKISQRIENTVPNLDELVYQSNQNEMNMSM